jgi:predicted regulator of Ras-like GTPase activity (Roadblock/LC7/MglB family)
MGINPPDRNRCATALDQLLRTGEDISAALLATRDGRPYLERSRIPQYGGRFAAMSSSLVALGHSVLRELGASPLDHILIEGGEGKLIVTSVPGSAGLLILSVLATRDARLGLVLSRSKICVQAVSRAFEVVTEPAA